jgi:hypothetical protein
MKFVTVVFVCLTYPSLCFQVALLAEHEAEASQSRGDDLNTKQHSKVRSCPRVHMMPRRL